MKRNRRDELLTGKSEIARSHPSEERQCLLNIFRLFSEANLRLKKAIERKDMKEVELAQAMLEGVKTVRQEHSDQKRAADAVQNSVDKRKSSVITDFFNKKPRQ